MYMYRYMYYMYMYFMFLKNVIIVLRIDQLQYNLSLFKYEVIMRLP